MTRSEMLEYAEDLGYVRYRCWNCGKTFYSDSSPYDCCGDPREIEQDEESEES